MRSIICVVKSVFKDLVSCSKTLNKFFTKIIGIQKQDLVMIKLKILTRYKNKMATGCIHRNWMRVDKTIYQFTHKKQNKTDREMCLHSASKVIK